MKPVKFYDALINNTVEHPERNNATSQRLFEVMENVLPGKQAEDFTNHLKKKLGNPHPHSALTSQQANIIIDEFDQFNVKTEDLTEIIDQLFLCELSTQEILQLHRTYKIPVSKLETDILPVQGNGCWIRDSKGDWFLDLDSNYSASNLGMANLEIAKGLYHQAKTLISMKEDRIQVARARFLKEISQMMPRGLTNFYWQNSGGEAVDKALKIAKAYTQTKQVVAFRHGFHGRTHGAVAVTHNLKYRKPFLLDQEDWVHFADFNDLESVKRVLDETGSKIIIMEMVQGEEAGNLPADQGFINQLWDFARENNIIIIDDEVQAGFGRTARKRGDWFACMSYEVVPDIMVIGKSFGGGYPVTAVVTSSNISEQMKPGYDGSTFGGNPMAMVSALIATRQMRRKNITENVIERSTQIEQGFSALQNKYDLVKDFRVYGLMIALDLGNEQQVKIMQEKLRDNGVKSSLSTGKYIRFLPPTIISAGEVDYFLNTLDEVIGNL
ncbi:MAG: hypothetical protein APR63_10155 [Desulfuromonas sp. SDB]|nr:MAG: hypothetical protein APR63_10155 [Desulfuromonas sp. SDB]